MLANFQDKTFYSYLNIKHYFFRLSVKTTLFVFLHNGCKETSNYRTYSNLLVFQGQNKNHTINSLLLN